MGVFAARLRAGGPRVRGYTLVELLVVLGIVAGLAGLLLTGVFAVRRKVDAAHCTANLQQLGMAVGMYLADYRATPLVYYGPATFCDVVRPPSPPPSHDIVVALGDYLPAHQVCYCPTVRRGFPGKRQLTYRVPNGSVGLRMSQIKTPLPRALMMFDGFDWYTGHTHGKQNALFLDGHVKAYDWVVMISLWYPNTGLVDKEMFPQE